ncbi:MULTISPECIES: hypothetical protein [unclassified Streptomyces]|uniref:hypothetical protein n=1 Tax=unclassified Streptomyces TaxID=2593676 RepID=UPI002DD8294B|nr:hypothetical protein [Streptomyces sp. NBC_00243]WRZ17011.1 hypothetical protein OHT59_00075 [Streptomyces sp. NBC_00243]WRZ25653.1 hypothetical protein OHT59_47660 [Streptomyces sp. NBC_00243]
MLDNLKSGLAGWYAWFRQEPLRRRLNTMIAFSGVPVLTAQAVVGQFWPTTELAAALKTSVFVWGLLLLTMTAGLGAAVLIWDLAKYVSRTWAHWNGRAAMVVLVRGVLVSIPALFMPSGDRRAWVQDVHEAFAYRRELGLSVWSVTGSYIAAFPGTIAAAWLDRLLGKSAVLELDDHHAKQKEKAKTGIVFRLLHEWKLALIFAIVAAVLMEPVMYVLTYWLHLYGLVWPWEYFLPMG